MGKRDTLIAGIKACGWVEEQNPRTTKYRVFHREGASHPLDTRLLVGRSGALRRTVGGSVAASTSLTDRPCYKAHLYVGEICGSFKGNPGADFFQGIYQKVLKGEIKV